MEYERKSNWLCLKTFKGEQEDVETMRSVNEILLRNILPETVADYFMQPDRDPDVKCFKESSLDYAFHNIRLYIINVMTTFVLCLLRFRISRHFGVNGILAKS